MISAIARFRFPAGMATIAVLLAVLVVGLAPKGGSQEPVKSGRLVGAPRPVPAPSLGGVQGSEPSASTAPGSGRASLTVVPSSQLSDGEQVAVAGAGLPANVSAAVVECNITPGEPTVPLASITVPVGCADPYGDGRWSASQLTRTSRDGTVQAGVVVHEGTVGPPQTGVDSTGQPAAVAAAAYPCPPTPAQRAAGGRCVLAFGDLAGAEVFAPIAFRAVAPGPAAVSVAPTGSVVSGDTLQVTGSGFVARSPAELFECNLEPNQWQVPTEPGTRPATGCTRPQAVSVSSSGTISTTSTAAEGNVAEDPAGVLYPCPPTPAQLASGARCAEVVVDAAGQMAQATLSLAGPVPVPTTSVTVAPSTDLVDGSEVDVHAQGFVPGSFVGIMECNLTADEPVTAANGVEAPVGCSDPFWSPAPSPTALARASSSGTVDVPFDVRTGVMGPPSGRILVGNGTDTTTTAEAAAYPCPPTPAEVAAGGGCDVFVVQLSGSAAAAAAVTFDAPVPGGQ